MTKTVTRRLVPDARAVKPGGDLRTWLDTGKAPSRLLTPIERHLLARPADDRPTNVLHPSEIIAADWCHRESYHLLRGSDAKPERLGLRINSIFEEGHLIHAKWQGWLREMGFLYGVWECFNCGWSDWAVSPPWCVACTSRRNLHYLEVPLFSAKHRIAGHADGWVQGLGEDCLIEIKSIGLGTVRMEAPGLLSKADGDLDKLWGSIHRPFAKHLRQGQIYLALAKLRYGDQAPGEMVFLYEYKPTQASKEFVVSYNRDVSDPLLEAALDIVWAVKHDTEPPCNIAPKGCPKCKRFNS